MQSFLPDEAALAISPEGPFARSRARLLRLSAAVRGILAAAAAGILGTPDLQGKVRLGMLCGACALALPRLGEGLQDKMLSWWDGAGADGGWGDGGDGAGGDGGDEGDGTGGDGAGGDGGDGAGGEGPTLGARCAAVAALAEAGVAEAGAADQPAAFLLREVAHLFAAQADLLRGPSSPAGLAGTAEEDPAHGATPAPRPSEEPAPRLSEESAPRPSEEPAPPPSAAPRPCAEPAWPARPAHLRFADASIVTHTSYRELCGAVAHLRRFAHYVYVDIEIAAMEVCADNILRYPAMPDAFHADMARQIWDEARHAVLMRDWLISLGGREGDYTYSGKVWRKCQLGATLAERLAIQQVFQEGNALESNLLLTRALREAGHVQMAAQMDFVNADEAVHARIGNRWLRTLAGSEAAAAAVLARAAALLGTPLSPNAPVDAAIRRVAGFSAEMVALLAENGARTGYRKS